LAKEDIKSIIEQELIPFVEPVKTSAVFRIIVEDPSDDKFLVLAVDGQADHIISGDKHLLGLKEFRGIKIVTAEEFLSLNMIVLGSGIKTGR
jgi:predicted nucleic acid-binding protein